MAERSESPMELLSPFCMHDDANRRSMLGTHILQSVPLIDGDIDKVNSIHGQLAHSGSTYSIADEDTKIIKRFDLFDHKFIIIHKLKSNIYDAILIDEFKNEFMRPSEYKENEIIKEGETLIEHESKDKLFNPGRVATTAIVTGEATFEDAVMISESFAKKLQFYGVKQFILNLSENHELINLYGDEDNFIPIAKKVTGDLCAIRKRSSINFLSFNKSRLNKKNFLRDYKVYEAEGETEIFCYIEPEMKIPKTRTWDWIKEQDKKTKEIIKEFIDFVNKSIDKEINISSFLYSLYNYYLAMFNNKMKKYDKKDIKGAILKVNVIKRYQARNGSKVSNKHGLKGLIKIVPDEQMFQLNNKPIDVAFDPTTIIGRMNMGAIREMQMNKIIDITNKIIKKWANSESKEKQQLAIVAFREFLETCNLNVSFGNDEELIEAFKHPEFDLIAIIDKPNIKAIDAYKPTLKEKLYKNGKELPNTIAVGKMYFQLLKHEPIKKSSAVALPAENEKGLPIRSNKKEYLNLNDSPSNWGTMEMDHLFMAAPSVATEFVRMRSHGKGAREDLARKLIENEEEDITIDFNKKYDNVNVDLFEQVLTSLGIKL